MHKLTHYKFFLRGRSFKNIWVTQEGDSLTNFSRGRGLVELPVGIRMLEGTNFFYSPLTRWTGPVLTGTIYISLHQPKLTLCLSLCSLEDQPCPTWQAVSINTSFPPKLLLPHTMDGPSWTSILAKWFPLQVVNSAHKCVHSSHKQICQLARAMASPAHKHLWPGLEYSWAENQTAHQDVQRSHI